MADQLRFEVPPVAEGQRATDRKIDAVRLELAADFKEVKALVLPSDAGLERRIVAIESELSALRDRVDRLESRPLS